MGCCCCDGPGVCCQGTTCTSGIGSCQCQQNGGTFESGSTCSSTKLCCCPGLPCEARPVCDCPPGCSRPCTCTQNSLGSACGVSYISVTTEFSFARCGGQLMSREFTLNAQNGWQHIIREPDQQGTLFVARALVFCFQGLWRLTVDANAQGGPCFFVCDTPLSVIGGIGGTILLPTIQNGSHCCPSAIQSWLRDDADCPGSRLAVTNMSIVLA